MTEITFAQEICRHLEWDLELITKIQGEERLDARLRKKSLKMVVSSPWVETFAVQTFAIAQKANHLGDFLGVSEPKFNLRALWLNQESDEDPETMVQWIIGCGFNCVIGGGFPEELLHSYGILKHEVFPLAVQDPNPSETDRDFLISAIEKRNEEKICYVENSPAARSWDEWLPYFMDDMPVDKWLAVQKGHPVWQKFRELPDSSSAPLARVITPKQCGQEVTTSVGQQPVTGVIVRIEDWPRDLSEESKELWVAGQSLWWRLSAQSLRETWDLAFGCYSS